MPFKSKAQRGLFYAKAERGEMPMSTVKKWEAHTPKGKKLPEHVGDKKSAALAKVAVRAAAGRIFLDIVNERLAQAMEKQAKIPDTAKARAATKPQKTRSEQAAAAARKPAQGSTPAMPAPAAEVPAGLMSQALGGIGRGVAGLGRGVGRGFEAVGWKGPSNWASEAGAQKALADPEYAAVVQQLLPGMTPEQQIAKLVGGRQQLLGTGALGAGGLGAYGAYKLMGSGKEKSKDKEAGALHTSPFLDGMLQKCLDLGMTAERTLDFLQKTAAADAGTAGNECRKFLESALAGVQHA